MSAKYFPNLFQPYAPLRGKDWIRKLDREALAVFVDIGLKAAEHGRLGGRALLNKRGVEYMREIGRRGAIKANRIKALKREQDERYQELGDLPF